MTDKKLLERIAINPKVMTGKPVIKGTRLTVEFILNLMAHGATFQEFTEEYKGLPKEKIKAGFLLASREREKPVFRPLSVGSA